MENIHEYFTFYSNLNIVTIAAATAVALSRSRSSIFKIYQSDDIPIL